MKLKIDEAKTLEFEMDTNGCSWKELKGFFRIILDGIEYGFPVDLTKETIKVDIPVINEVLNERAKSLLHESKVVEARLDLIANNEAYISPWSGKIDIEIPISVNITEEKSEENKFKHKKVTVIDPDVKNYLDEKKQSKKSKFLDVFSKTLDEKDEKIEGKQNDIKDKDTHKTKKSRFSKILN